MKVKKSKFLEILVKIMRSLVYIFLIIKQIFGLIKFQSGIAAILVIVIIGASALIMASGALLLSLGGLEIGYAASHGREAFFAADGCAEETMRRIRLNPNYSASDLSLSIGDNSCIINLAINGNDRVINAVGIAGDYQKEIEVGLTLSSNVITINSWEIKDY